MHHLIVCLTLAVTLCSTSIVKAVERTPPGVGVRTTLMGQTFVDDAGMTLYQPNAPKYQPGGFDRDDGPQCTDQPTTVRVGKAISGDVDGIIMRPRDAAGRKSCFDKYPPFLAPSNAEPFGKWGLYVLPNGDRQWTYDGLGLYRSAKDRLPGDTSGQKTQNRKWRIAVAPLSAPAGVETRITSYGLTLTNHLGKTLYYNSRATNGVVNGDENWQAFIAPILVKEKDIPPEWSLVKVEGNLRQWAWRGHPLYTYAADRGGDNEFEQHFSWFFVDIFGDIYGAPVPGWSAAILVEASNPPTGVTTVAVARSGNMVPWSRAYADKQGRTLYFISCVERTADRLDCDDVGDSPNYWLSFCGGEERCKKMWKPFTAPADAKPIDGLWSVGQMNPTHPFKPIKDGETGIPVWKYQGQFIFTHADDERPGDTWGLTDMITSHMFATLIPAFASSEPRFLPADLPHDALQQ